MTDENEDQTYSIDELSAHTGVPSRTVRFYQSKGALQPPTKKGRKAFYGSQHVERLGLIGMLQDRGLQIRAIRTLISEIESGARSLDEWLGLGDQLRKPWTEDVPQLFSETEMREMLQGHRAGLLGGLLRSGTVQQQSNQYLVRSPALLKMALALETAGVDIEIATAATEILDKHLTRAASDLTRYFVEGIGKRISQERQSEGVADFLDTIKPIALDAVRVMFAHRIEGELGEVLSEGKILPLAKRSSGKRSGERRSGSKSSERKKGKKS